MQDSLNMRDTPRVHITGEDHRLHETRIENVFITKPAEGKYSASNSNHISDAVTALEQSGPCGFTPTHVLDDRPGSTGETMRPKRKNHFRSTSYKKSGGEEEDLHQTSRMPLMH